MKWFVKCINNYVNFRGRARRSEFWYFVLFSTILAVVATILDSIVFGSPRRIFYGLVGLFLFLPGLAVQVRRLHDTNRSGKLLLWMLLAYVIWIVLLFVFGLGTFLSGGSASASVLFLALAIVGGIAFLVWCIFFLAWYCTPGTPGDNQYGPDPKAEA